VAKLPQAYPCWDTVEGEGELGGAQGTQEAVHEVPVQAFDKHVLDSSQGQVQTWTWNQKYCLPRLHGGFVAGAAVSGRRLLGFLMQALVRRVMPSLTAVRDQEVAGARDPQSIRSLNRTARAAWP